VWVGNRKKKKRRKTAILRGGVLGRVHDRERQDCPKKKKDEDQPEIIEFGRSK